MKKPISSVASVLAAAMSFTPVYSPSARASDDATIPACGWAEVIGPDGYCYNIYDTKCSNTMYVADNTVAEWYSFYMHPDQAIIYSCGYYGDGSYAGSGGFGDG